MFLWGVGAELKFCRGKMHKTFVEIRHYEWQSPKRPKF
jgi:hypothetical protein